MTDNQSDTKFRDWSDALLTRFKGSLHFEKLLIEIEEGDFDVIMSWTTGFLKGFHGLYPKWVNETWSEEQTQAAADKILKEAFWQDESSMFEVVEQILRHFIPFLVQEGVCTEGVDWTQKIEDLMKAVSTDEESIDMREMLTRIREEGLEEGLDFDVEGAFDEYLQKWIKREQLLDELAEIAEVDQGKANTMIDALPEEEQAFLMKKMMSEWEQNFDPKNGQKALEKLLKKTNGHLPKEGEAFEKAVKKHLTTQEQIDLAMMLSKFEKEERAQGRDSHDYDGDDDEEEGYWYKSETVRRQEPKIGRNDPCPCGSGKKYKKCHGK